MSKAVPQGPAFVDFTWTLAELPTSQHRAGLAGLVLMLRWLDRQPDRAVGICQIVSCDEKQASIRVDRLGLQRLFDWLYAASTEETRRQQPYKNKDDTTKEPLRMETEEVTAAKTGKVTTKTWYVYPVNVPSGGPIVDWAPSSEDPSKGWVKLWRDFVWTIMRGVPAQRGPYNERAEGKPCGDAAKEWLALTKVRPGPIELASTYLIGAMAATAENVAFKDVARFRFLLHFWPLVAQLYVPRTIDREGKVEAAGFAVAIPDVVDLDTFCAALPQMLAARSAISFGYRPKEAFVDLALESALDCQRRLREQLGARFGDQSVADVVLGFDVFQMEKAGNSVRILASCRCEPTPQMVDEYARVRTAYWSPIFRRQRLFNLAAGRPWHDGFDRVLQTADWHTVMPRARPEESRRQANEAAKQFQHDARQAFESTEESMDESKPIQTPEQLVYRAIGSYLSQKLKNKHGLSWKAAQGDSAGEQAFSEARQKIAREVFLAVRSRTGAEFVDYFATTLFSVPQHMNEDVFVSLAQALHADPDRIRTLTLLALSARA